MISLAFANLRASAVSLPPRMAVVLHSSDVFVIAKTRHQQMDSGCIFVDEVSAPHICKSTLFTNYLFFCLLRWTGVPLPRFPLISFCLSCSLPAVLLLSSKTASVLSKRQKGYRFNRCPRKLLLYMYSSPPYCRN